MFHDVLNENGKETLGKLISFSNGKKRPDEEGQIPVYGGNGILAYTNKANASNCVIIGRVGAYCGNVCLSLDDCWISDNANSAKSKISKSQLFVFSILKNENLEQQAQAIYAQMFIESAEESWETGSLSDIAVITMGQSPKGDTFNETGEGAVFYQGRTDFGFRFPTRRLYTTEPKRIALCDDALMSVRAPVGDLNVAYEECCIGRGLAAIHSKDNHQSFVLYTLFTLKKQLDVFNGEGTVFGSINKESLNYMEITIPPRELMDRFESTISPIDRAIRNNYEEICRLQAIRDTLLPKLMNGEIDVSAVKI